MPGKIIVGVIVIQKWIRTLGWSQMLTDGRTGGNSDTFIHSAHVLHVPRPCCYVHSRLKLKYKNDS